MISNLKKGIVPRIIAWSRLTAGGVTVLCPLQDTLSACSTQEDRKSSSHDW